MAPLPLVLVHGGAHGAWCWEPTVPHLDGPVLAIDLPPKSVRGGDGRREPLPELLTLTIDDFAIVDDRRHRRCRLRPVRARRPLDGRAHDLRGRARAPERVARLVYVSCIVPPEGGSAIDALPPELHEMTTNAIEEARAVVA